MFWRNDIPKPFASLIICHINLLKLFYNFKLIKILHNYNKINNIYVNYSLF